MMMAVAVRVESLTRFSFLPSPCFYVSKNHQPPSVVLPFSHPHHSKLVARLPRLQATPCLRRHLLAYACVHGHDEPDKCTNCEPSSSASKEAIFDIKLPRRNLLVQFTCNSCGERTQRIINRLAYERGTVFVQCAGCFINHKLVDNLGLVVEYDLRNEIEVDSATTTDG